MYVYIYTYMCIYLHNFDIKCSLNEFEDVYIVNDLMETDLHRVIYSRQALGMTYCLSSLSFFKFPFASLPPPPLFIPLIHIISSLSLATYIS